MKKLLFLSLALVFISAIEATPCGDVGWQSNWLLGCLGDNSSQANRQHCKDAWNAMCPNNTI